MSQKLGDRQLKCLTGCEGGSNLDPKTSASGRPSPSLNLQVGVPVHHARSKGLRMMAHCPVVGVQLPKSLHLSSFVQRSSLGATEPARGGPLEP